MNRNGTCLTQSECSSSGGRSGVGACASGFGVCCVFVVSGAGTVTRNNTYIQNAGFPLFVTAAGTTTYTVNRIQSGRRTRLRGIWRHTTNDFFTFDYTIKDVAFLRLDFEVFSLSRGGVGEVACDDTFTVTVSNFAVTYQIFGRMILRY